MFSSLIVAFALLIGSVYGAAVSGNYDGDSFIGRDFHTHESRAAGQIITKCSVPQTAALTFDDGPWWYLYDISKTLIAEGGRGTFFFNGLNNGGQAGCIYNKDQAKRVKYAYDKGHQVASHTWSHKHLTTLNNDQLHHEFWLMEEAIMKITGAYPAFMRPPYGEYDSRVVDVARIRGQAVTLWDFDSNDWKFDANQVNAQYTALANAKPSSVLALNHEHLQHAAHVVLPHAIRELKRAGYKLVTLAECVGQAPYQWVGNPFPRDASWTCQGK